MCRRGERLRRRKEIQCTSSFFSKFGYLGRSPGVFQDYKGKKEVGDPHCIYRGALLM